MSPHSVHGLELAICRACSQSPKSTYLCFLRPTAWYWSFHVRVLLLQQLVPVSHEAGSPHRRRKASWQLHNSRTPYALSWQRGEATTHTHWDQLWARRACSLRPSGPVRPARCALPSSGLVMARWPADSAVSWRAVPRRSSAGTRQTGVELRPVGEFPDFLVLRSSYTAAWDVGASCAASPWS